MVLVAAVRPVRGVLGASSCAPSSGFYIESFFMADRARDALGRFAAYPAAAGADGQEHQHGIVADKDLAQGSMSGRDALGRFAADPAAAGADGQEHQHFHTPDRSDTRRETRPRLLRTSLYDGAAYCAAPCGRAEPTGHGTDRTNGSSQDRRSLIGASDVACRVLS